MSPATTPLQPCIPRYLAIFFPIFCDLAKVMIIARKILAKYGYMLNIKYYKKNMLLYLWLLYLNHAYLSIWQIFSFFLV